MLWYWRNAISFIWVQRLARHVTLQKIYNRLCPRHKHRHVTLQGKTLRPAVPVPTTDTSPCRVNPYDRLCRWPKARWVFGGLNLQCNRTTQLPQNEAVTSWSRLRAKIRSCRRIILNSQQKMWNGEPGEFYLRKIIKHPPCLARIHHFLSTIRPSQCRRIEVRTNGARDEFNSSFGAG